MIRVVTIARQYGSGGGCIAKIVAERLRWRLLDRELLDEIIRIAGIDRPTAERCDEKMDPIFHKLLKSLWHGGFAATTTQVSGEPFDSEAMTRCARIVIEKSAEVGNCVIVGRGAQCILENRDDTLNVFIWAPTAHRIPRVMERFPDETDPEGLMAKMDKERSAFIRREFDRSWCDHKLYDLVIDSALGDEVAAECILAAIPHRKSVNG